MNFLQLVESLRIETGASGRPLLTLQGTLAAETERLKRWTASAWNDIQLQHINWNFHYIESSHTLLVGETVLNQTEYAAGDVAEWMVNSFRISDATGLRKNSQWMRYIEYYDWRDNDGLDNTIEGKPDSFTIHPQTEAIHLTRTPDLAYELFYDYRRTPQVLEADEDIPIIPTRYHELIVAWAMKKYGFHEVAGEKLTSAQEIIGRLFSALELDQLDEMTTDTL